MRTCPGVVALLVVCCLSVGHPQGPPAVDLKDPAAVAAAYADACRQADVDAALALLAPTDPAVTMLREMVGNMREGMARDGYDPGDLICEFLFIPMGLKAEREPGQATQEGDRAQVKITARAAIDQNFILARQPDGTWRVDLLASIKATTSTGKSALAAERASTGRPGVNTYPSQRNLMTLHRALEEYATEHGGQMPPAESWVDELEPYVLDPAAFRSPARPELSYGYAMNEELSASPLPQDWRVRSQTPLLFEWPGGERNAHAKPADIAAAPGLWPDGSMVALAATGSPVVLPSGVSFGEKLQADEERDTCSNHLAQLAGAARRYARAHEGVLPGAQAWQDDLALYLAESPGGEQALICPSAPGLACGYAINEAVAGRRAADLVSPDRLVLFFESDQGTPNASGSPDQDASPEGRHWPWSGSERVNNVVYLSGERNQQPARVPAEGPK